VSFTFGCPAKDIVANLARRGSRVVVTVTSAAEAVLAAEAGADALCVQGAEAGGHRGTFDNPARPDDMGLLPLLRTVIATVDTPLIAAGGLSHGNDIAAVLVAGARAAQLGTIFLACPESGAHKLHKEALTDPAYPGTAVTRAFTGRPARGLVNRFVLDHSEAAPAAYPHVRHVTRDIIRAAAQAGDTAAMFLLAGQAHRFAREQPAAQLVRSLAEQARAALNQAIHRWPTG
jgi:nitronate monooxygenase